MTHNIADKSITVINIIKLSTFNQVQYKHLPENVVFIDKMRAVFTERVQPFCYAFLRGNQTSGDVTSYCAVTTRWRYRKQTT